MPVPRKILLVDNHEVFREGLKKVIATTTDMIVADEVGCGQELLQNLRENSYDLVILDISIPGRNGLDILIELKKMRPKLPVLVLSMYPEEQYALRAYKSGASGYLTKGSPASDLLDAMQKIISGGTYVRADQAEALVATLGAPEPSESQHTLSNREFQVMCLIASGKTVGRIAAELSLSVKTISTYRSQVLRKLHLLNNSEMTRFGIENHLV